MLGGDSVFVPYWRDGGPGPGLFTVRDVRGPVLVPETSFNPEGPTYFVSSVASGCRVFLSYQDVNDGQKGKFQVLDFSDVCTPPPCPEEVTELLDILRSRPYGLPFIPFRLQWVLVRNRTANSIPGPLAFVMHDLKRAAFLGSTRRTDCLSETGDPFAMIDAGDDDTLTPGEVRVGLLLFFKTERGPITYEARVLAGLPSQ